MDFRKTAFQAIGTEWSVEALEPVTDDDWQQILQRLHARIDAFDAVYSRFRGDSLVTRMSQRAGNYELPEDGYALLQCYERLYQATHGKITPLIGQVMVDAGYDANYSLQVGTLQSPPRWEDVLSYDARSLTLRAPALLDFGAAGKGYLVDLVGELIAASGLNSYLINAGGDILHRSVEHTEVRAGLENPADATEVIGVATFANQSLCASAGTKRQWSGLHHIIDPDALHSPESITATWVLADSTMLADGLASALFFTDPEILRWRFNFSYALLDAGGGLRYSKDFPVTLFEEA